MITAALVRRWVPDRLGPLVHAGRSDEAQRALFSEGFAEFYTHCLLLRTGQWTPVAAHHPHSWGWMAGDSRFQYE